jgi:ABC-2 type transport system ATP-binding protein
MLDEPVSGLDAGSRRELFTVLSEAKAAGSAVLLSTHQFEFVEGLVDTVVVLDQGSVAAVGSYEQVRSGGIATELGLL